MPTKSGFNDGQSFLLSGLERTGTANLKSAKGKGKEKSAFR